MDFSLFNLKFSENLFKYIPGTTLSSCLGINCIDPLLRAVLQKGLCDLPAHKFKMNTPYLNLFLCTLTFFFFNLLHHGGNFASLTSQLKSKTSVKYCLMPS